jgi:hypothetical protein
VVRTLILRLEYQIATPLLKMSLNQSQQVRHCLHCQYQNVFTIQLPLT